MTTQLRMMKRVLTTASRRTPPSISPLPHLKPFQHQRNTLMLGQMVRQIHQTHRFTSTSTPSITSGLRAFSTSSSSPSSSTTPPTSSASSTLTSISYTLTFTVPPRLLRFFNDIGRAVLQTSGWEKFGNRKGKGTEQTTSKEEKPAGSGPSGGDNNGPPRPPPRRPNRSPMDEMGGPASWIIPIIVGIVFFYFVSKQEATVDKKKEITFQEFKTQYLETHQVDKLEVDPISKRVAVFIKHDEPTPAVDPNEPQPVSIGSPSPRHPDYYFYIGSVDSFERQLQEAQLAAGVDPHHFITVRYGSSAVPTSSGSDAGSWISTLFLLGLMGFFLSSQMKGMMGGKGPGGKNPFNFGKNVATLIKPGDSKVTFKDVAGLDDAKVEVLEFVKFLQNPERFTRLGAKIPKGALLCGPPGTGKTMLAKAVAGEAGVPFYSISGPDFIEMFVGVGASRVRDLFTTARANTPCIIFIDEIDAVGRARSKTGYGNDERESTLNQLLVEMDGMVSTEGVVVLAGTNRKDVLDKALLRPGRFDRHITIDKPDLKGRAQIFMVHLARLTVDPAHTKEELSHRLAALTPGFAGADIANLCNEAALIAARADKKTIQLADFESASDRVIGGLEKKSSAMSLEEKTLVAHHEAGHAVAAWFLEHADPLLKVTIVPRGNGALGFAQYLPKELSLYHQAQLSDMMAMALGGRAAEQIFFGRVSTGASDDLQKVTRIAQAQVTVYGMSERLGQASYAPSQEDGQFQKPYSEATAQVIDEEVRKLIEATYKRVVALLEAHKPQVELLAKKLIETENVNHDVLISILGERPFASDAYTTWKRQAAEADALLKKTKAEAAAAAEAAKNKESDEQPELATA